ncbi:MAG: hypothetical protein R6V01_09005 [Thermoplasmatota archaeon]
MKHDLAAGSLALLIVAAVLVTPVSSSGETIEFQDGEWSRPHISNFDISMENDSGIFVFSLDMEGSCPPGTEDLQLTFGTLNGSTVEVMDDLWIEEGESMLLGNGYVLEKLGNGSDPWSSWRFHAGLSFPMDMDLDSIMEMVTAFTGEDPGGIEMPDNETLPGFDVEGTLEKLSETQIYVIARAYNKTGAWGQDRMDVTNDLLLEVISFLSSEDLLPDTDDDDTGVEEEDQDTSEKDNGVLIAAFGGAAVIFLAAALITTFFILWKKKKGQ